MKAEISLFMKYVTFCLHVGIKEKEGERADNYGTCPERQSGRKTHSHHPVTTPQQKSVEKMEMCPRNSSFAQPKSTNPETNKV